MRRDSVRIDKLCLEDYGVFRGMNEILFDRPRTIIAGPGGTGKTTIFCALANQGPAAGVRPNASSVGLKMYAEVMTSGNRALLKVHRDIIFLRCESLQILAIRREFFINGLDTHRAGLLEEEAMAAFRKILQYKPHKARIHHDLDPKLMAAGERFCLGLSWVFSVRRASGLDLPIVMDSPYGWIDKETRQGLSEYLRGETCQQILIGSEAEFREAGDRITCSLAYADGGSRIVCLPA